MGRSGRGYPLHVPRRIGEAGFYAAGSAHSRERHPSSWAAAGGSSPAYIWPINSSAMATSEGASPNLAESLAPPDNTLFENPLRVRDAMTAVPVTLEVDQSV